MIVYGPAPPWEGGGRYGRWVPVPELWDGPAWRYVPPTDAQRRGLSLWTVFGEVLRTQYLAPIQRQLNEGLFVQLLAMDKREHVERTPSRWERLLIWFGLRARR